MRSLKIIKGDTVEEKIVSIDGLLNALNKKEGKVVNKCITPAPITFELKVPDTPYPVLLTTLKGVIKDFVIFIQDTNAKNLKVKIELATDLIITSGEVVAKTGFTKSPASFEIEDNTLVVVSYSMEEGRVTTNPIIGFSFTEKKDVS